MKITMDGREFNRIMRTCVPAISKDDSREALRYIEIRCKGGVGVTTACDGVALAQCHFEYVGDDGVLLLHSHRSVKNDALITIEAKGKKISVSDDSETVVRKLAEHTHPNWKTIVDRNERKTQRASIVCNPARLRRILDSFSGNDDSVFIEIRDDLDGIVMRGANTYAMVLPIRENKEQKRARFVRPEFEAAEGAASK